MVGHLRRHAIAYVALFVSLGGTSYAALKLPANSVGTAQLKKNAVTSKKVKDHSLTAADFAKGVLLTGAKGDPGPKGDPGAPGANGSNGTNGQDGTPGIDAVTLSDDGATPTPPAAEHVLKSVQINMSRPGKLLILDATVESASANNQDIQPHHWASAVYVDGVGVPGTFSAQPGTVPASSGPYALGTWTFPKGLMTDVSAGTHTVSIGFINQDSGSPDIITGGSGRLLVVATG